MNLNYISEEMHMYFEAVEYYEAVDVLQGKEYKGIFVYNVLLSLCIELNIKSILKHENIETKKQHNLLDLHNLLPSHYEKRIFSDLEFPLTVKTTNGNRKYDNITSLFQVIANSYIDNRYLSEKFAKNTSALNYYQELKLIADYLMAFMQDYIQSYSEYDYVYLIKTKKNN